MKHLKKYKLFESSNSFKSEIEELFNNYVVDECSFTLSNDFDFDENQKDISYSIDYEDDMVEDYLTITIGGGDNINLSEVYVRDWIELSRLIKSFLEKVTQIRLNYKLSVLNGRGYVEMSIDEYILDISNRCFHINWMGTNIVSIDIYENY